ncbi:oxidoreductase- FAD-binding [Apiospora kogelbergensis]|uniref:Oxidoreductase- FAD-binding n=1 Tax=Apiospora kogelbergensis TaxID=1337665 RepID=A0AAW0QY84_9PEZI
MSRLIRRSAKADNGTVKCMALSALLGDKVAVPLSGTYNASLASYFAPQQSAASPLCIISPETTDDVSAAIRTITASKDGCHFALRSGGHSTVVGASNIDAGVTFDLRHLDSIQLSPDRHSVRVGAGAPWGAAFAYLVGVGGLAVGGGISYLGPRHGWTCDTVVNFEVVTANGSVVNANRRENPDLRWALCGGGNSFGVVTRVDLQAFAQEGGQLWGGVAYHNISNAEKEISALADFSKPETYDGYSSLIATFAYAGGASTIVNSMVYTKPEKNPAAFRALSEIPSSYDRGWLTAIIVGMNQQSMGHAHNRAHGRSPSGGCAGVEREHRLHRGHRGRNLGPCNGPAPPGFYARHAAENALGLDGRRSKALMVILFSVTWRSPGEDGKVDRALKAWVESTARDVGALGALDPYLYLNYAAAWQQNPISSYGKDSIQRLARIQRDYDPQGVFTKLSPGGVQTTCR